MTERLPERRRDGLSTRSVADRRTLWREAQIIAERGGATAFAALVYGRYVPRQNERVGIVICGANTTAVDFTR